MLKRRHLAHQRTMTLALSADHGHPKARATIDIDLFLRIELLTRPEEGRRLREVLDRLSYKERTPKRQFERSLSDALPDQCVVVDLLARQPVDGEDVSEGFGWYDLQLQARNATLAVTALSASKEMHMCRKRV